jgi:peptidoglycan hydrolase CwlO-like protein
MKFFIPVILFFSVILCANEQGATKSDIQMILKVMEANKVDLENQIKATNQRINDMNNRLSEMNVDINSRFSEINGYILTLIAGIFATVGFMF